MSVISGLRRFNKSRKISKNAPRKYLHHSFSDNLILLFITLGGFIRKIQEALLGIKELTIEYNRYSR